MKKFLCMLLALVMALSLVACGEQKQPMPTLVMATAIPLPPAVCTI